MVQPLRKTVWQFLSKLKNALPYDPTTMLLGIHTTDLKTYVCTTTYTQVFAAVLFIFTKSWKQPRSPSVGEQINKTRTSVQWII